MKNFLQLQFVLMLLLNNIFGHEQTTHKYMTVVAYDVLKKFMGNIPKISNQLGTMDNYYNGDYPFQRRHITTGAYREDEEDIVYGFDSYLLPGWQIDDWLVSITHFWDADNGDVPMNYIVATVTPGIPKPLGTFHNAYQKIIKYAQPYKSWEIKFKLKPGDSSFRLSTGDLITIRHCGGVGIKYNTLIELYTTGKAWITGYFGCPNTDWRYCNHEVILGQSWRDAIVWEILGRMCHLVQDMSVPAHAHVDEHGMYPDFYEQYMGLSSHFTLSTEEFNSVPFINPYIYGSTDPLHFLMYVVQQVTDHFASCGNIFNGWGDSVLGGNVTNSELTFINNNYILSALGKPETPEEAEGGQFHYNVRAHTYPLGIGATAGLLYWFAKECNLIPPPTPFPPIISSFTLPPNPINRGTTEIVTCNLSQGSGSLTFEWFILKSKPGVTVSFNESTARISYYCGEKFSAINNLEHNIEAPNYLQLACKVSNELGYDSTDCYVFFSEPPAGGGCPFVYSWNGEDWIEDNNILPQSQDSTIFGQDVTDFYQLYSKPRIEEDKYYLAVGEFEHEKSYLDQLKLIVVDHHQETFITVNDEGQIIQFAKPAYFASAELDSVDVYKKLYQLDEEKVAAQREETMRLSFEEAAGSEEKWLLLIGQVSAHSAKERYAGSIIDKNKESFTSFRLRKNPSYQWVLVPQGNTSTLQVEILWKEESLVDYTELSRKLELPFTVYTPELINAEHNVIGDVRSQLLLIDEDRVELNPNECITLEYSAPPINEGMERSFVFVSRGRYETLPDTTLIEGKKQIPPMKKSSISSVNTSANEVIEYKLSQNYPNPFNPVTTIHYSVKEPGFVSLILYDLLGREAATLVSENKIEGNYTINFDASNLSSGIYVCRIKVNKYSSLMKMVVLK